MTVEPGQIYRSCNPLDEGRMIRIILIREGRAWVESHGATPRPRWMSLAPLHATATTRDGKPRRTGYALEKP